MHNQNCHPMMDSPPAECLKRSLSTMRITLRLVQVGQILCGISFIGTIATLGFGLVLFLPVLALAGLMFFLAALAFWLGLVQSLMAADDRADRLQLWPTVVGVPALSFIAVGAFLSSQNLTTATEITLIAAIPVYVLATLLWLRFARSQARRVDDPATAVRMKILFLMILAIAVLCLLAGSARYWLPAMNAQLDHASHKLGDIIESAVYVSWFVAAGLSFISSWLGSAAIGALRASIASPVFLTEAD